MYKELIISIFVVIVIILANSITQNYTKQCVEEITQELSTLKEQIMQDTVDEDKTNEYVSLIYEKWLKMHNKLAIYIEHDELEKVEIQLIATKSNIEVNDYETSVEKLDACKFILEHIQDKESLNWSNIF